MASLETPFGAFQDFGYVWPSFSSFLSPQDIYALAATSYSINRSLQVSCLRVFNDFFTNMSFREQEEAASYAEKLKIILPHQAYFPLFMGEIYRIQGLYKKAIYAFDSLEYSTFDPLFRPYVLTAHAMVALWKRDQERAVRLLDESFMLNPEYTPTLLYRYAIGTIETKQKAIFDIQKILKRDPTNFHAQLRNIDSFVQGIGKEKNLEYAKDMLQKLLCNCSDESAHSLYLFWMMVDIYINQGKLYLAFVLLQSMLAHKAIDDTLLVNDVYILCARILLADSFPLKNPQKAREYLEKASQVSEDVSELYTVATYLLHKNLGPYSDTSKAMALCSQILTVQPKHLRALQLRGFLALQSGSSPELAFQDLYAAYLQDGNDRIVYSNLIKLLRSEKIPKNNPLLQGFIESLVPLCSNYFSLSFQQKKIQARIVQDAANALLSHHPDLANCCLGEVALVLGDEEKADSYFLQQALPINTPLENRAKFVAEYAASNKKADISRYCIPIKAKEGNPPLAPPLAFYRLSRFLMAFKNRSCPVPLIQALDLREVFGLEELKQLRKFYSTDALTECFVLIRSEDRWNEPRQIERLFSLDPTNLTVARQIAMKLLEPSQNSAKEDNSKEICQIVDAHLSSLLKLYPNDPGLLILLAMIKMKVPNCDKQLVWDLYTQVMKQYEGAKDSSYADALILRVDLLLSSGPDDFPQSYKDNIDKDLLLAYEQSEDPLTLLKCAELWTLYPEHFTQGYLKALTASLRVYRDGLQEMAKELIGKLYLKGGFGIIQNKNIADVWSNGFDQRLSQRLSHDECLDLAESLLKGGHVAEAALYLTIAFITHPTQESQDKLIQISSG